MVFIKSEFELTVDAIVVDYLAQDIGRKMDAATITGAGRHLPRRALIVALQLGNGDIEDDAQGMTSHRRDYFPI